MACDQALLGFCTCMLYTGLFETRKRMVSFACKCTYKMSSSAGNYSGATLKDFLRPKISTIQDFFLHFGFQKFTTLDKLLASFLPSPIPPHGAKVPASGRQVLISVCPHAALTLNISCLKLIQSKSRCSHTGFAANQGKNIAGLPSTFKH